MAFSPWLELSGLLGGVLLRLRGFSGLSSLGGSLDPDSLPGSRDLLGAEVDSGEGLVAGLGASVVAVQGGCKEARQTNGMMSVSLEDEDDDEDDDGGVWRAAP